MKGNQVQDQKSPHKGRDARPVSDFDEIKMSIDQKTGKEKKNM